MNNPQLITEKSQVDNLFAQIQSFSGDPYLASLLTYYLCVRVSGFLENCVRIIFNSYSVPRSQDNVVTFVSRRLERFPNPTFEAICSLTKDFDVQWQRVLKSGVGAQIRSSIESISNNRNAIAHGGNSTITLMQLASYYRDAVALIETLEQTCV